MLGKESRGHVNKHQYALSNWCTFQEVQFYRRDIAFSFLTFCELWRPRMPEL